MTVVFDGSSALAGTDDGNGNQNFNMRQLITAAALSSASGTQMRVTVLWGTGEGTETPGADAFWGGQSAQNGTAHFSGNQVQFTFSGSTSINGSAAGTVVSDWMTLGETYDNTKEYCFAVHFSGTHANISLATDANCRQTGSSTLGASTASQTTPSPDMDFSNSNTVSFISKIEIQAAGGGDTLFVGGGIHFI